MAERVRAAIEAEVTLIEGIEVSVTASIGGALGVPDAKDDKFAEVILAAADEAMYEAKGNGRNDWRVRELPSTGSTGATKNTPTKTAAPSVVTPSVSAT